MVINIPKLILSVGLCLGAGILGSIFTFASPPAGGSTWYAGLNKPFFSPPNWIFGPVWTILYILMGISLYLIWIKNPSTSLRTISIPSIFWIQLVLNAVWSIIFFGMKNPLLALVDVVALWIAIFLTIKAFSKINKLSAYLLYPYLAWVTFASILNLAIVFLNP